MFKERYFNKTIVIVTSFCYIKYKTEINKNNYRNHLDINLIRTKVI
jgi:hypothetical protein